MAQRRSRRLLSTAIALLLQFSPAGCSAPTRPALPPPSRPQPPPPPPPPTAGACAYWFEAQRHGFSFRDAASFGAVGDGLHDDTLALRAAIDFERGGDAGSDADKSAAFVYLRNGTYLVSDTLVLWKWTKLAGNAVCPPTIVLAPAAPGFGDAGALKPLLVTNNGFNSTTADHAWWREDPGVGGATNDNFFTQMHHVRIRIAAGNPGAVAVTWNVAQQTSIRDVVIDAGDAAVGLDVGAGRDYQHWADGSYSLGGGGVVEDVAVRGGGVGMRIAAAQFFVRNVSLAGAASVGLRVWQLAWSLVFHSLSVAGAPLGVDYGGVGEGEGALQLLDSSFAAIGNGVAVRADAGAALYLQNVAGDASVQWVVQDLARPPVASLFSSGRAYDRGVPESGSGGGGAGAGGGPLPLPTLAQAAAAGVRLACGGGRALCGGSADAPHTAVPYAPLPSFDDPEGIANALDAGCKGDGATDDTAALQAAISGSRTLFIPMGIYIVSDTLRLRPDSRIVGEGLSVLLLAEASPGFGPGGGSKPLVAVPVGAEVEVAVADIALWNMHCGNDGVVLLEWGAGANSTLHDVNMLVGATAAAKAVVVGSGVPGVGAGLWSNVWWPAAMSYIPSALAGRGGVVARRDRGGAAGGETAACLYTPLGIVSSGGGPLFFAGANFEHAVEAELLLLPGATDHIILGLQTEEAPVALSLNGTRNAVIFGARLAFWNASQVSPAQAFASRPAPAPAGTFDFAYRLYGLSVPIADSELELFVDSAYTLPAGPGFQAAVAVLNSGEGA